MVLVSTKDLASYIGEADPKEREWTVTGVGRLLRQQGLQHDRLRSQAGERRGFVLRLAEPGTRERFRRLGVELSTSAEAARVKVNEAGVP